MKGYFYVSLPLNPAFKSESFSVNVVLKLIIMLFSPIMISFMVVLH